MIFLVGFLCCLFILSPFLYQGIGNVYVLLVCENWQGR